MKLGVSYTFFTILTTMVRPMMLFSPESCILQSVMLTLATPSSPAVTLPKSPTWRTSSQGPPWVLPSGLKCGPAEMQPKVKKIKLELYCMFKQDKICDLTNLTNNLSYQFQHELIYFQKKEIWKTGLEILVFWGPEIPWKVLADEFRRDIKQLYWLLLMKV